MFSGKNIPAKVDGRGDPTLLNLTKPYRALPHRPRSNDVVDEVLARCVNEVSTIFDHIYNFSSGILRNRYHRLVRGVRSHDIANPFYGWQDDGDSMCG